MRERREDIIPLCNEFLDKLASKYGIKKTISKEGYELLYNHSWPGNIRELRNLIERIYVMSHGEKIGIEDMPKYIKDRDNLSKEEVGVSLRDRVIELEQKMIEEAYQRFGNVRDAAKYLGIDASTLVRKRRRNEGNMTKQSQR